MMDEATRARIAQGDLPEIDAVDAERVRVERMGQVIKAERDLQAAAFSLGLYLRTPDGRPAPPTEARPPALPTPEMASLPSKFRSGCT